MRVLTSLTSALVTFVHLLDAASVEEQGASAYDVAEIRHSVPVGWQHVGPADKDSLLSLRLMVNGDHGDKLSKRLMSIGTPGTFHYGKHLCQEQLQALTAPDTNDIQTLKTWIALFSIKNESTFSLESSSFSFQTTVNAATEVFRADFQLYSAENNTGNTIIRAVQYSLPKNMKPLISMVHPITHFPTIKTQKESSPVESLSVRDLTRRDSPVDPALLAACIKITPTCIAKLYNITYNPPTNSTPSGSSLGVASFLEQYINHTDISLFVSKYGNSNETRAHPGTFTVELVNGGTNNESYYSVGIEATLDMEYSMPFTGSLPVTFYSTGGRSPTLNAAGVMVPSNQTSNEPYLEWLEYMLAKPDGAIPQVISISYTDTEIGVPRSYAEHRAKVISTVSSNDGLKTPMFLPTFPASCPWVTAVGSTSYLPPQGSSFSSGGFSNYFGVPDYQIAATANFITALNGSHTGLYNASGRGIPDVAVYGSRYETENAGTTSGWHSGTSAGTPVFAAMIALVNDVRLRNGKSVLGWLNPTLYAASSEKVWTDITEGFSYGCTANWEAVPGWDAVTGLGSPDFERLLDVLG